MARMRRWALLTGVLAAGAFVGPLGSRAQAQVRFRAAGYSTAYYSSWGWRNPFFGYGYGFGYGGFYGGYSPFGYGGYYPGGYGGYFYPFGADNVLPYPLFTYASYPIWSYVPSSANAPYPKVIEARRDPAPPPANAPSRTDSGGGPGPAVERRTVVYRANLNSVTPAYRPSQPGRMVVLRPTSR